jgi:hypothetical protein
MLHGPASQLSCLHAWCNDLTAQLTNCTLGLAGRLLCDHLYGIRVNTFIQNP